MLLTFWNDSLLQKKKTCDRENKLYRAFWKRRKFYTEYKEIIDRSECVELHDYVTSILHMAKKEVENHYEQKRLRSIAKDLWSDYVWNIIRKKYWWESYARFKRSELPKNKLF